MNLALQAIFNAKTRDGVRAEHTEPSFWLSAFEGSGIAEDNQLGYTDALTLASFALEDFDARRAEKAKPVRKKNNKTEKKAIPVTDIGAEDEDEDDDDEDDDNDKDDEEDEEEPEAARLAPIIGASSTPRSAGVAALVARCEKVLADPLADASSKKIATASLRQVGAAPKFVIEVHDQAPSEPESFQFVEGKRVAYRGGK